MEADMRIWKRPDDLGDFVEGQFDDEELCQYGWDNIGYGTFKAHKRSTDHGHVCVEELFHDDPPGATDHRCACGATRSHRYGHGK
jgi:hypothetical protein